MEREVSEDKLREWLRKWQDILRVQDWDVEIDYKRKWDMPLDNVGGACEMLLSKRTAKISVLEPVDRDPGDWPFDPLEQLVIHECLHLHTDGMMLKKDGPAWTAMEQMVHSVARALYALGGESEAPGDGGGKGVL